jgi:hypothetical protein
MYPNFLILFSFNIILYQRHDVLQQQSCSAALYNCFVATMILSKDVRSGVTRNVDPFLWDLHFFNEAV